VTGHPVVVAGIPLPSDAPLFLAVVGLHVLAGATCAAAGLVAMLSRKQAGRHPLAGSAYFWALCVVFATMAAVSAVRWSEDYPLFLIGAAALAAATFGREARRRRWPNWARLHMSGMGASYILLLTAFYVDNGPNLPVWRLLPQWVFWVLPAGIGLPILANAFWRHPLVRQTPLDAAGTR
jgi:hypothetical protein